MELTQKRESIFRHCCFGYFYNGLITIILGAILPFLMQHIGLNYAGAGSILAFFSLGNFLGSFFFNFITVKLSHKKAICLMSFMPFIYFCLLMFTKNILAVNMLFLLIGLSKGSITLFNNYYVNNMFLENPAPKVNILNACFAVGAFISPFILSLILILNINALAVFFILAVMSGLASFMYYLSDDAGMEYYKNRAILKGKEGEIEKQAFFKDKNFIILMCLLFFYLGFEYSINGWFVTYLKDTGIMSIKGANTLISFMWLCMLISRLSTAKLSTFIRADKILMFDSIGLILSFLLLISTQNIYLIIFSLLLLGIFMAPVFPLGYANARKSMQGLPLAMTIFSAGSSIGGIIAPYMIGIISKNTNIKTAVFSLSFYPVIILLLAIFSFNKENKK